MANEEHLKILKQGVEVWNKWRKENPWIRPDLSKADLRGRKLACIDFYMADLYGAKLDAADLEQSSLIDCNLSWASLTHTNLQSSTCVRTLFWFNDLSSSNMSEALVWYCLLTEPKLDGATANCNFYSSAIIGGSLSGTIFESASFCAFAFVKVDLSRVIGLEKCSLDGLIAVEPRIVSDAKIPPAFLKGCGFHDDILEKTPPSPREGIEYHSCFISFTGADCKFVNRLHADLRHHHVPCWLATQDLKIGAPFREAIDQAIRSHDRILLVLSKDSISSEWVRHEVEAALEKEQRSKKHLFFPIRIDDLVMKSDRAWAATLRRERHIGDFTNWKDHDEYQKAFDRLLKDLQAG